MIRVIIRKDLQTYLGSNIQSEHIKHYVTKYQFYQQLPQQYTRLGKHRSTTTKMGSLLFNIASTTPSSVGVSPSTIRNERTCVINTIWKMGKIMKLLNNSPVIYGCASPTYRYLLPMQTSSMGKVKTITLRTRIHNIILITCFHCIIIQSHSQLASTVKSSKQFPRIVFLYAKCKTNKLQQ